MSADFNSVKRPTARKPHRCDECRRTIEPGEKYERTAAVWEGDFFTNVACAHCAVARRAVAEVDSWYWESFYGGLREWLSEIGIEVGALRLYACVRAKWRYQSGALMPLPAEPERRAAS